MGLEIGLVLGSTNCGFCCHRSKMRAHECQHSGICVKSTRLANSVSKLCGCTNRYSPWNVSSIIFVILIYCLTLASSQTTPEMPPIVFTQQPQAGSPEIQGNTKVLLCQATGFPPPVYRWKKDGNFITEYNITDTSLKISNIQRSDDGEYQCIASNTPGAILSNKVHVRVAYLVPFAGLSSTERTVDQGQAYIMDPPSIESYPSPLIKWFEISTEMFPILQETQKYHVTLQHQLVILETQTVDDRKVYKARATNSYTGQTSDSQMFVLHVQSVGSLSDDIPPEIVIAPSHTTAVQGDDDAVILECVANARPINYLSLNWYKREGTERTPIEQDYIKYLFSIYRRQLTVKAPDTSDSGVYECEAVLSRPGGVLHPTDTAVANLTVLVKPSFATPPPADLSRDYGQEVEIPCQAVGIPAPTIVWYRNTEAVEYDEDARVTLQSSGSLRIVDISPTDSAVYQCFASNGAGEINGASWLKVLSSVPEIITRPENQSVIAGDSARFSCEVTGAPEPTVVWYRVTSEGMEYLTEDNSRINILDRELLVPVTEVADSGRYVCNATNSKGIDWADAWLRVSLRTRIVAPPQNASVIKGSNHIMPCGVTHDLDVEVTWMWSQDTVVIPLGDTRRRIWSDGSLEIRSVRNDDIGLYRCDVTSSAGDDTASAAVQVIELPYSPSITSVLLNGDDVRSVDVRWQAGFDGNTPIRYYIVQFRLIPAGVTLLPNEAWQVASSSVSATERLYTVTDLQPARSYQFRVSAVNDVGEGQPSESSEVVEMPQQPPSGPPRGVVASPRSESSIILQWQAPDEDRWNGPLQGYVIRYKPSGYPDSTLSYEMLDDLSNLFILTGLIIFTEYELSVAAYNAEGVGVYSDITSVRTQEGSPTQPPRNVLATAVSSTSIRIQWLPPDPQHINGINQGYKIQARRVNVAEAEVFVTVPSNTSNMLGLQTSYLSDLFKFTEYEVRILCFTAAGDGPMSDPEMEQTLEDVPDQVGSLNFANILDTSLQVIWTPPDNINGILVGYTLTYMKAGQVITMVTQEVGPNSLNYTITGLTATTTYTIEVYARTRVGAGPPRSANIDSGIPPEQPEAPRNLAITNIQASSVLLQFVPGFDGHTSISEWIVEGQVGGSTEWERIYSESAPAATSIEVQNLRPYTNYVLRLIAENVAGESEPSEPTREFQTIQAPPSGPPQEVTVRAVNETAIRATWKPLASDLWNGEGRGYLVQYRVTGSTYYTTLEVQNENANSYIFSHLEEYTEYDVRVASHNNVGNSEYSPVASDRTMESVPSSGPVIIEAGALTSTSIRVIWTEIPENDQNGLLLGYKVYYTALEEDESILSVLDVEGTDSYQVTLTSLRKYTLYSIQLLAYTRIGDGVLSAVPAVRRTFEDVPGPPSSIFFPDVTHSTARVLWSPPREPNGIIIGYRVTYREKGLPPSYTIVVDNLSNTTFEHFVTSLTRTTYYEFNVTAKTQLGWGVDGIVDVYTIINRRIADPPSQPSIGMSQVGADWVTINWQPGNDGYGPIRNYTIQYLMLQPDNLAMYVDVQHYVPPNTTAFTIQGLHPNTQYQFRIAANNDLGMSEFSAPSEVITTKQAAPGAPPEDLEVIPKTTTSVLVTWQPPPASTWNGPLLGYQVAYRNFHTGGDWLTTVLQGASTTATQMDDFVLAQTYEFQVLTYNAIGQSDWSSGVVVFMEFVPTEAPVNFVANTMGATDILVSWSPPPSQSWNGDLLGYKIFYWTESDDGPGHVKTVAATETEAVLSDLGMFTEYALVMLAFNAAGDGPNTTIPITATTTEGIPGQPGVLHFTMTSLTALNVSWDPPSQPNGFIEAYEVSYYQDMDVDGESRSVQVRLAGDKHSYLARELTEDVLYVFNVKARTSIDWGLPRFGNITTGPQPGSPAVPSQPQLSGRNTNVLLTWTNGYTGDSPIIGYIIQGRERNLEQWETLMRTNTPEPEALVSFYNLKPNTEYQFRVIAVNSQGISSPSFASDFLMTLEVDSKAFYEQWWFLVIVALTGLIFIIIVISLLCLTGKRKKANSYKDQIPKTTIRLEDNHLHHMQQMQPQEVEEAGFGTLDSAASRRSQRRPPRMNTLPPYTRSPPRPSPGSVVYSDEDAKNFADDGSDITEKPSDASSSEASESEPETEKDFPPPAFTNHYVNGDIQQSWQRQRNPARDGHPSQVYNYTDSEQDSQYAVTLNGGHVIMNNMAGSRAPLPGFSSFV